MTTALERRRPWGVLLINVGTPDAPEAGPVRRYLREFLSDPRVLDISAVGRFLLLELIILPFRPRKSAEAYRKVWLPQGSPLRVHSEAQVSALRARLGVPVELGMQYGNPSVPAALGRLREAGVEHVVVVPLYPQHSSSATGSAIETVFRTVARDWAVFTFSIVPPFYDHPGFLDAFAEVAHPRLAEFQPDHVLFSYHGLPERHMRRADASGSHCLASETCCASIGPANRFCYRAQCYATTASLAGRLGLAPERHSVSFQSRLGRTPWIRPYTDVVLPELAKKGVKRVAVMCPAFVADCLETLEEIGIRAREDFKAHGGEELILVPSLNATPRWIDALADLALGALPQSLSAPRLGTGT